MAETPNTLSGRLPPPTPWVLHRGALVDDVIDIGFGIAFEAGDYGSANAAGRGRATSVHRFGNSSLNYARP